MKITQELKDSPTFIFAKMKGCNNREAARFCQILSEGINGRKCDEKAVDIYLRISKEPKVAVSQFNYSLAGEDGTQKPSRSKLVMEYEKHRKAFLKILSIRQLNQQAVDKIVSHKYEDINAAEFSRLSVLATIAKEISPNA
jgi:hypothetical protein